MQFKGCNGPLVCMLGFSILLNTLVLINQERQRPKRGSGDNVDDIGSWGKLLAGAWAARTPFGKNDMILVTGAAGFIGMHTSLRLVQDKKLGGTGLEPAQVVGMDNYDDYYSVQLKRARSAELEKAGIKIFEKSVCDSEFLERLFHQYQFTHVIHLAAQPGVRYGRQRPDKYIKTNVECFDVLLESIRNFSPKSYLVYASSSSVYGANKKMPFSERDRVDSPISLYGATKRMNELLASVYFHNYGLHSTGLRFFTVYGEWGRPDMAAFKFSYYIDQGIPLKLFEHGDFKRDFTYVGDIADGIISACQYRAPSNPLSALPSSGRPLPEIFNLGNSQPVKLHRFIRVLELHLNKTAIITDGGASSDEVATTHADVRKAASLLGWQPRTSIEDGLQRVALWYHTHAHEPFFHEILLEGRTVHQILLAGSTVDLSKGNASSDDIISQVMYFPDGNGKMVSMKQLIDRRNDSEVLRRMSSNSVIAIIMGTTSRGLKNVLSIEAHPLWTHTIPSIFATIEYGFEYWVYVGFDQDDPLFDSPDLRSSAEIAFKMRAEKLFESTHIEVKLVFLRFFNPDHKPGPVFNFVSAAAFKDGADYFYRVNDDINFETPWAIEMVRTLANLVPPNVGVVGPICDEGNRRILTFDFTHRTHTAIFGTHYPPELTDWWLDDWISTVYPRYNTLRHPHVRIRHVINSHGRKVQRYSINWKAKRLLDSAIQQSRLRLDAFLQRRMEDECKAFRSNNYTYSSILAVAIVGENLAREVKLNSSAVDHNDKDMNHSRRSPSRRAKARAQPSESAKLRPGVRAQNNTALMENVVDNSNVIATVLRVSLNSMYSPPWVVVMLVNKGILAMALNWICNIQNLGLWRVLESTTFVALDAVAYRALSKGNHNTVFWKPGGTNWHNKQTYGSSGYFTLIHLRQKLILDLLHHNISILVGEPDATWYGDLIAFVESEEVYRKADALAYNDSEAEHIIAPCGGLLFLRPTANSKALIQTLNTKHKEGMLKHNGILSEQSVLRKVWTTSNGSFVILPGSKFSSGLWYRQRQSNSTGILYIHANFMKGVDKKIGKMKARSQWFLDDKRVCHQTPRS